MAKSEQAAVVEEQFEAPPFDAQAILDEDLGSLPAPASVIGSWRFQLKRGFPALGTNEKGPWGAVNLVYLPIGPVGLDAEERTAETDMEHLPEIRHYCPYTTYKNKSDFRDLMALHGADTSPGQTVGDMLDDNQGAYIIATAKPGKDNRGKPETKLSNFRSA